MFYSPTGFSAFIFLFFYFCLVLILFCFFEVSIVPSTFGRYSMGTESTFQLPPGVTCIVETHRGVAARHAGAECADINSRLSLPDVVISS